MIARLLYLIFMILVARLLFRSVIERLRMEMRPRMDRDQGGGSQKAATIYKGHMVRDPQCGVYFPENRSVTVVRDGERVHFCSRACADAYRETHAHGARTTG
jgi:YHS domain-containing protein